MRHKKYRRIPLPFRVRCHPIEITGPIGGETKSFTPLWLQRARSQLMCLGVQWQERFNPFVCLFGLIVRPPNLELLRNHCRMIAVQRQQPFRKKGSQRLFYRGRIGMHQSVAKGVARRLYLRWRHAVPQLMQESSAGPHHRQQ